MIESLSTNINSKRTCFLLVSGVPGIGKTTFSQQLSHYIQKRSDTFKAFLISYDNIIDTELESFLIANSNNSGGTSNEETQNEWKQARNFVVYLIKLLVIHLTMSQAKATLENFIENETHHDSSNQLSFNLKTLLTKRFLISIQNDLSQQNQNKLNNLIVIDDLFYYESMRYSFFKLAIDLECAYVSFCFKSESLELLLERNSNRETPKQLKNSIIKNVWEKFEFPNENIWEINFSRVELVTKTFKIGESYLSESVVEILDKMNKFYDFLAERKLNEINKTNRQIESEQSFSLIHECDLVLRKLIGEKLSLIGDKKEKNVAAQKFSISKNLILNEIKLDSNDLRTRLMTHLGQNDDKEKRICFLENEFRNRFDS